MNQEYYIGLEDLDRLISKAYLDQQEAVRLALLSLRDIAIQRKDKAKPEPFSVGFIQPETEVQFWYGKQSRAYDSERLPATGNVTKSERVDVQDQHGDVIAYYYKSVPVRMEQTKGREICDNCGRELLNGICLTWDCASGS